MARSLMTLAFVSLTFVALVWAFGNGANPFGLPPAQSEARQDGYRGAGWQAVMPSRLIAIDSISL